jgi:hypothetical protein
MISPHEDSLPEDDDFEHIGKYRPGLVTILISLLIVLALLASLIIRILQAGRYRRSIPTPTPRILLEAGLVGGNWEKR